MQYGLKLILYIFNVILIFYLDNFNFDFLVIRIEDLCIYTRFLLFSENKNTMNILQENRK